MEIDAEYPQRESPAPTPLSHDPIPSSSQHLQHSSSSDATQSPPSKYLRVAPEAHTAPLLATRTTPVLLTGSRQIPLAQSYPTLVPRQTHLPAVKRLWQKASSTHVMAEPIRREEDEESDVLQSESQAPQEDSLGLYDDPDAGDEVHHDPLLHTERRDEDLDADTIPDVQATPFNSQPVGQVQITPRSEFEAPLDPRQVYQDAHPDWFGRIIIILVAILHAKHRVSFRACALILHCVTIILLSLGILHPTQPLPTTLNTVIHRLDLHDRFTIYPVCGHCHRIFPTDIPTNALCPDCDSRLFKPVSDRLFRMVTGRKAQRPPPVCAAPIQVPSSLLADFLARGGNKAACESWKSRTVKPGELHDISDGAVWRTIQGPDETPFFSGMETSQELRIGVTMSLDWYLLLTYSVSYIHVFRYRAENLLVSFMTPGPTEPTGAQLQNYLRLVVDDLLKLYEEGVVYHTPGHPEG
ncbi:hypothetical protein DEU56DRAFT_749141 [Suillus clintonianus]|uniref:uncharacterized protein n=1 Tax=Suillus clintonianus TaxID=1904413 RepID=UPI001B864882|nr:uncharacterized protein DEU56DRAFT_749141 [Suillus clintonianus]KAG2113236.1 hypothetical protein DEU56DRAFT_749141 [Suillus clintonianus]